MDVARITACVALNGLFDHEQAEERERYLEVLATLRELAPGIPILGPQNENQFRTSTFVLTRKEALPVSDNPDLPRIVSELCMTKTTHAVFVIDAVLQHPDPESLDDADSDYEPMDVYFARILVEDTARSFVYAANIAKPGSLGSAKIHTYVDGRYQRSDTYSYVNDLWSTRAYARRTGWPVLADLDVIEVWSWLAENALYSRTGDSRVSRAFNAFTHLFAAQHLSIEIGLIVTMTGLEALFGDGRPGIGARISERAQLLLGERTSFQKDLGRMYQLRSALVHGSLGFPPMEFAYVHPPAYESRYREIAEVSALANAVLVGALQRLALERANEIAFKESVQLVTQDFDPNTSDSVGREVILFSLEGLDDYIEKNTLK